VLEGQEAAALLSNRAAAHAVLGRWEDAAADAQAAVTLQPRHTKAHHRLGSAHLQLGRFGAAVAACRAGTTAAAANSDRAAEAVFRQLLDRVSAAASLAGSSAAFDGRTLHVRCAGEEAWLCLPAPYDALLDAPEAVSAEEAAELLRLADAPEGHAQVARATHAAELVRRATAQGGVRPLSFRSLRDALAAARDGDRIILQEGHHNVGGLVGSVDVRVLIRGEGAPGATVVEQRGNAPLLSISCPAVVQNLVLDLCGFRECVRVQGGPRPPPLLEGCSLRCSGDHAVVCVSDAAPMLRRCDISARRAGLLAQDTARPTLHGCTLRGCEEQGVRAMGRAVVQLERCAFTALGAEGVVAMDDATVRLLHCSLRACKGPACDASGQARLELRHCSLADCAGGVFLWDAAAAAIHDSQLAGGPHHALLADQHTEPRLQGCAVRGDILVLGPDSEAQLRSPDLRNVFLRADAAATLPPESGCFKFEADRFSRKQ